MMQFPPVEKANADGVLCVGGVLSSATLREAYFRGIFPWPVGEAYPVVWFAPPRRGVLLFEEFHIPRSARKLLRRIPYQCQIDTCFEEVITACANRDEKTWITRDIIAAYCQLHREGHAHSIETFLDGELVGGLYGVSWGKYFCGESMFHRRSGASKAALVHLINHLQQQGFEWIDIQNISPLFRLFGAREIVRSQFMQLLNESLAAHGSFE